MDWQQGIQILQEVHVRLDFSSVSSCRLGLRNGGRSKKIGGSRTLGDQHDTQGGQE